MIRNGGSDHQIAPSKVVNIHTKNGIVKGVSKTSIAGYPKIDFFHDLENENSQNCMSND